MNIRNILVIRFSSLGDIILLTPLFRELKKKFPQANIDFFTSTTFQSICLNNPNISTIIPLDRKKGNSELSRIVKLIKSKNYDLFFDAHYSLRSRLFLFRLFGARYFFNKSIKRIDKRSWKRNLLLSTKINLLENHISQREAYCRLLDDFSEKRSYQMETELFPSNDDKAKIRHILHQFNLEGKTLVAMGPGASFQGKCWPKENYLKLSEQLQASGFSIVLLGGADDSEPGWMVNNSKEKPLDLSGKLSFIESAALLKQCQLTISNDSAVFHLSEAVGTPAITIFGPTVKEFGYAPFLKDSRLIDISLPCRPCSRNGKGNCKNPIERQCLYDITVDLVFEQAFNVLKLS